MAYFCLFVFISSIIFSFIANRSASTFTIVNSCPYTIWPDILANAGMPQLPATGFRLDSGQTVVVPTIPGWSGRIWARTRCSFDLKGIGICETGDCGGRLECNGIGPTPPASLFEVTLGINGQKDFYDVSLVDGYNLPLIAAPQGVSGQCNATGCAVDINIGCPKELQVTGSSDAGVVACKSACEALRLDRYCCSGEYANPSSCRPSFYSSMFKGACPRAYSYAFDDETSTFTCEASEYAVVFCPLSRVGREDYDGDESSLRRDSSEVNGKLSSSSSSAVSFSELMVCCCCYIISMSRVLMDFG